MKNTNKPAAKTATKSARANAPKVKVEVVLHERTDRDAALAVALYTLSQKRLSDLARVEGLPVKKYKADMINCLIDHMIEKDFPVRVCIG